MALTKQQLADLEAQRKVGVTGLGLTPPSMQTPAPVAAPAVATGVTGLGLTPPSAIPVAPAPAPAPRPAMLNLDPSVGLPAGMLPDPANLPAAVQRPAPAAVAAPAPAPAPSMLPATGVRGLGLTPPGYAPATLYPADPAPAAPAAPAAPGRVYARPATTVPPALPVEPAGPVYARPGTPQAAPGTAPAPLAPAPAARTVYPRPAPNVAQAVPTPVAATAAAGAAVATAPTTPAPVVAGASGPVAGLGLARQAAAPAVPSAPAVLAQPGADGAQPVSVSEGAMAPPVAQGGTITRNGNSFSGTNVGLNAPGVPTAEQAAINGANNVAAINRDIEYQKYLQTRPDPNAPTPGMSATPAGFDPNDPTGRLQESIAFGERAALNNAVKRNSGSRADQAAVQAALAVMQNRQRKGEVDAQVAGQLQQTTLREGGDTARLGLREAGDTARAAQTAQITAARDRRAAATDDARTELERRGLGLKEDTARLDNATRRQLQSAQQAYLNAKTPEEQKAAYDALVVLGGKAREDTFKAVTVGGGSVPDPVTGIAVPQPQRALVLNTSTGQFQEVGAPGGLGAAPAGMAPRGMRQVGTSGGKPVYEDANGKRFQ